MRYSPLLLIAALAASTSAHALDGYVGVGIIQAPDANQVRVGPGATLKEDNDAFARAFGGI